MYACVLCVRMDEEEETGRGGGFPPSNSFNFLLSSHRDSQNHLTPSRDPIPTSPSHSELCKPLWAALILALSFGSPSPAYSHLSWILEPIGKAWSKICDLDRVVVFNALLLFSQGLRVSALAAPSTCWELPGQVPGLVLPFLFEYTYTSCAFVLSPILLSDLSWVSLDSDPSVSASCLCFSQFERVVRLPICSDSIVIITGDQIVLEIKHTI